jgi:two-component system chemotaxis sensor kinase CheA
VTGSGGPQRDALAARLTMTFASELDDSYTTLVADTLALERDPSDSERERSVFRIMHTLKGAARAAGVPAIETLCHAMESELSRAKTAGAPLTPQQLSLLLAIADAFSDASQQLKRGQKVSDDSVAALLYRLSGRGGYSAPQPTAQPDAGATRPVTPLAVVTTPPAPEIETDSDVAAVADEVDAYAQTRRSGDTEDQVRIGVSSLDGLLAVTGEVLRLAARMEDQPADLLKAVSDVDDVSVRTTMTAITRRFDSDVRVLHTLTARLVGSVRRLRQRPFADVVEALPRAVRDLSASVGKPALLVIEGGEVQADRPVLELLREPLLHLVRNAVDHGLEEPADRVAAGKPEEGTVRVRASMRSDRLRVTVSDDGPGIDLDALRRRLRALGRPVPSDRNDLAQTIFDDGFSTRESVTAISGRGVGLGIVQTAVEAIGGTADVSWKPGAGTTFTLEVPVTVAVLRAVIVDVGGYPIALPTAYVERIATVGRDEIRTVDGGSVLPDPESPIPFVSLAARLGAPFQDEPPTEGKVVTVRLAAGTRRLAAVVRDVLDEREIVMHPLEISGGGRNTFLAGSTLLPDGKVALVVDIPALLSARSADGSRASSSFSQASTITRRKILVVDDSITTRSLEESVLSASGYEVDTAVDGAQAWEKIRHGQWDLVVSDIEMPHMDGIELCRKIREFPGTQSLPVILVTSLDKPADRMRGLDAGADAYITKSSFDQDTLLDTIRQLIGRGEVSK